MHPILFSIGPFKIYSYGVMMALAFMFGTYLADKRAIKNNIDRNKILDLIIYILISSIIGARILYVAINWQDYAGNPFAILKVWEGGLVFYGGLILGILVTIWYLRKNKLKFLKVADIISPSLALGSGIGRIGCFLNGCCYGKDPHIPLQLIESAVGFIIFFILLILERRKSPDGFLFWVFIFLYSLTRFMTEGLRYYETNYLLWGMITISQLISIVLCLSALTFIINGYIKKK